MRNSLVGPQFAHEFVSDVHWLHFVEDEGQLSMFILTIEVTQRWFLVYGQISFALRT